MTRKPSNIREEDLVEGNEADERPAEEATNVSYLIQRIRLAEISREVINLNAAGQLLDGAGYDRVLETSAKFQNFMLEVPWFLTFDHPKLKDLPLSDPRRSVLTTRQACFLSLLHHLQLCELHLPYLTRGSVDATYAMSRATCVSSARAIMKIHRRLQTKQYECIVERQKVLMLTRTAFIALISLVLNACLDAGPNSNNVVDTDLMEAMSLLQEHRERSSMAETLLERATHVLRRHSVAVGGFETTILTTPRAQEVIQPSMLPETPGSGSDGSHQPMTVEATQGAQNFTLGLDQWEGLGIIVDTRNLDWETILVGLEGGISL